MYLKILRNFWSTLQLTVLTTRLTTYLCSESYTLRFRRECLYICNVLKAAKKKVKRHWLRLTGETTVKNHTMELLF